MQELKLKYGCNPNQKPARIYREGGELPIQVLNGQPGYINLLDALNSWQLVSELKKATGLPTAASFKHVSPAGAAVGLSLSKALQKAYFVDDIDGLNASPLACAYARARGADRLSSFGDWIALSDTVDETTAKVISREVSDGVIAPAYSEAAFQILRGKRKGGYTILQMDAGYIPDETERRQVFGLIMEQRRNDALIDESWLSSIPTQCKSLPEDARRDLLVSLITLKYTQSNSVCFARDGQVIGVGAGQQSRVHCTRLAADKADLWQLRQHEAVLSLPFLDTLSRPERDNAVELVLSNRAEEELANGGWQRLFTAPPRILSAEEKRAYLNSLSGVSLGSDAFFPFDDSILRAAKSGVSYVAQPGGSVRDQQVVDTCDKLGIVMAMTGLRLFHH